MSDLPQRALAASQRWRELTDSLTAENTRLKDELQRYEAMLAEAGDIRALSWHIQRRRGDGRIEWFSTAGKSVYGPFPTALAAFESLAEPAQDGDSTETPQVQTHSGS